MRGECVEQSGGAVAAPVCSNRALRITVLTPKFEPRRGPVPRQPARYHRRNPPLAQIIR